MLPFLLINILVSAATVIAIWSFLDRRQPTACGQCDSAELTPLENAVVTESEGAAELVLLDEPVEQVAAAPTAVPVQTGPTVHTVVAGEVLSAIAEQYDVGMQDIVDANGLADVNALFVGQELVIPSDDPAAPVAAVEVQPEPTAAVPQALPTAAVVVGDSTFEIGSVIGAGDISAEQVLIVNVGPNSVDMTNWTLSNDAGGTYTFGTTILFGNGAGITLHSGFGDNSATDLFWGLPQAAWQAGQVILLRDANGNLQAEFTIP